MGFEGDFIKLFCQSATSQHRNLPYNTKKWGICKKYIQAVLKYTENINPLKTKRGLLYLKTQFVPRSKHFSSRL